jgi:hypothetical protein
VVNRRVCGYYILVLSAIVYNRVRVLFPGYVLGAEKENKIRHRLAVRQDGEDSPPLKPTFFCDRNGELFVIRIAWFKLDYKTFANFFLGIPFFIGTLYKQ